MKPLKFKLPMLKLPALPGKWTLKMPDLQMLQKTVLAVEIGDSWLKMATATDHANVRRLTGVACEPVQGMDELSIALKISQWVKTRRVNPSRVLLAFPSQHLTARILSLPSIDPNEIKDIVELQAVKQTPYSREEITSGFHLIDSDPSGYSRVFLAISHRDQASHYFRTAEMAFFLPDQMTPSVEGLRFWFQMAQSKEPREVDETVLLLDVDESSTDLLVLSGQKMLFARSIGLGSKQIKDQGAPAESDFLREVQRSLESGSEETRQNKISRVVLTGLQDACKTIAALLSRELNVPCEVQPPLQPVESSASKEVLDAVASCPVSYAALAGLLLSPQLSSINLMPPDIRLRKGLEQRAKELAFMGTLLLMLVMLGSLIGFEKIYKRKSYLDDLKNGYSEIKGPAQEVDKIINKMKLAQEQSGGAGSFLEVLNDIAGVLPESLKVSSLDYSRRDKNVVIRGTSADMSSVFQFLSTLEATPSLEQVKTRNVTKRKDGDRDISEFEIVANLIGPAVEGASS